MVQNLGIILLKIIFPMIPGKCPLDTQRVSWKKKAAGLY
jgi:hypothetical protein